MDKRLGIDIDAVVTLLEWLPEEPGETIEDTEPEGWYVIRYFESEDEAMNYAAENYPGVMVERVEN